MLIDRSVSSFLEDTASSSPAPGGGSVSALASALGASLTAMVCRLTIGKKKYADVEETMKAALTNAEEIRFALRSLIDADTQAFNTLMMAFGMPKDTEDQRGARAEEIESATQRATQMPLEVLRQSAKAVDIIQTVADHGNVNSRSDAGVAAVLIGAGARGAAMNVMINLPGIKDAEFVAATKAETVRLEEEVTARCQAIAQKIRSGLDTVDRS
ncbi:MAG: hypothetical protein A3H45_14310 [Ignavibacteria bacterium RIFCSPLOWO2_02_FULL_55_14]|nr:MAG: hypothetical protein A3H45_14310 [Ignavibacteria bacterium RIFCSPLOWO2_02_FULL_55_14]